MAKYQAASVRRPYEIALLVVAVAAAGFNLRTAITSLPPIFPDLQTQLHLALFCVLCFVQQVYCS